MMTETIPGGWGIRRLDELSGNKDSVIAGPFGSNLKVKDYRENGTKTLLFKKNPQKCESLSISSKAWDASPMSFSEVERLRTLVR